MDHLQRAVREGDEIACRDITLDLYLAGFPVAAICDDVVAVAMHQMGDLWGCGEVEIYQERLGCEIFSRLLEELRRVIATPDPSAAVALGSSPNGDPYTLAGQMVELVLRDVGWQATSLGSRLPFLTLAKAVHKLRPRLFWLSVSSVADEARFLDDYREFRGAIPAETVVVIGGRALTSGLRQQMDQCTFCNSMTELAQFSATLLKSSD